MAKAAVRYCVIDAFTDSAFKGNPAAVCLLEEEKDDEWLQAVAREFNLSETCFLTRLNGSRFALRWFTPTREVELCGHATLAASHFLFSYGLAEESDRVEFSTLSGTLTARRIPSNNDRFLIQLHFPASSVVEYNGDDTSYVSKCLNGASFDEIHSTLPTQDILVLLPSYDAVCKLEPNLDEIKKCSGRGLIVTAVATSEFDFCSRFFCPKFGINEDPVCGSAHCALAVYWSRKLGKSHLIAYQASARSGVLYLDVDEEKSTVVLRGEAVTVMEGSVLV
ncbi:hypothetical protein M569_04514 [Genlisea aurea]|uniref:Uncharacterized protein n=1 Tax=Genlisea aurea TaxID=192259 RepID=S8CYY2_9LAMI|nr:hypothetical protein M569_04514 [Genlisea aurea]